MGAGVETAASDAIVCAQDCDASVAAEAQFGRCYSATYNVCQFNQSATACIIHPTTSHISLKANLTCLVLTCVASMIPSGNWYPQLAGNLTQIAVVLKAQIGVMFGYTVEWETHKMMRAAVGCKRQSGRSDGCWWICFFSLTCLPLSFPASSRKTRLSPHVMLPWTPGGGLVRHSFSVARHDFYQW